MRRSIRSRKRFYLGCLSPEIMLMISTHLDAKDHANLCLVSRSVRRFFMHINLKSVRFAHYQTYLGPSLDAFMNTSEAIMFNRLEDARPDIKYAPPFTRFLKKTHPSLGMPLSSSVNLRTTPSLCRGPPFEIFLRTDRLVPMYFPKQLQRASSRCPIFCPSVST